MKVVSRFEANLLTILHTLLERAPLAPALRLVLEPCDQPECLNRKAVDLVQDTLAKGCVLLLAQQGGWRRERHLRGERVAEGRLWERTPPAELGLKFSGHSLGFLVWLTAVKLGDAKAPRWQAREQEQTVGDRLLLYLAYHSLADTKAASHLQAMPAFQLNPLCRLMYPEAFSKAPESALPDFAPWTAGLGACMLEVLQTRLAKRWIDVELSKGQIDKWQGMRAVGQSQERVLQAFLKAVEKAGRRDLARFVLHAAAGVLTEGVQPSRWVGRLSDAGTRLADRAETYRAALALVHQLAQLREWTQLAQSVGYFDEGYAASQLWKADWEHWQGDLLCNRAQAIIQQLDPMRQT